MRNVIRGPWKQRIVGETKSELFAKLSFVAVMLAASCGLINYLYGQFDLGATSYVEPAQPLKWRNNQLSLNQLSQYQVFKLCDEIFGTK